MNASIFRPVILVVIVLPWSAVFSETQDELWSRARELDVRLKAGQALELYLELEKLQPENAEVPIAIARQYRHLMADAESSDEKLRLGSLALAAGERAVALGPEKSNAHLSIAITCGKMMPLKSARDQVGISARVKSSLDTALKLNPHNDLALHVLGRWHLVYAELGGVKRAAGELLFGKLPESTYADAAVCFEKARAEKPRRLMHSVELGIVYIKMGRIEEGRQLIEYGLALPSVEKDDPDVKRRGREALQQSK